LVVKEPVYLAELSSEKSALYPEVTGAFAIHSAEAFVSATTFEPSAFAEKETKMWHSN
jgi:hypothetical protein